MDIKSLRYFLAVARQMNFTKAAEECCITQTAISKQISKLENCIGVKLFERNQRQVNFTPQGRQFYKHALDLLEHYEHVLQKTKSNDKNATKIAVGIGLYEHAFITESIKNLQQMHPELQVTIVQSHYHELINNLKQGHVDVAIALPTSKECVSEQETNIRPIFASNLHLMLPNQYELTNQISISIRETKKLPFVTLSQTDGPCALSKLKQLVTDAKGEIQKTIIANNLHTQMLMVELGLGVAFIPEICINHTPPNIRVVKLEDFSTGQFVIMRQKLNKNKFSSILYEMIH